MSDSWPPPPQREYRGTLNFWQRLVDDPTKPPRHVHACPECYFEWPCIEACTLEPDLERSDGTPAGYAVVCGECKPPKHTHPCPYCLEDAYCISTECTLLTVADDLELARGHHRVCQTCKPGPWPIPEEQLRLFPV